VLNKIIGLFKPQPKPETPAEDLTLVLLNCANDLKRNDPMANLSAPFAVITMAIALRRGYSMEPEPESIVANICSSNMQDRESSKILRGNIDTLRGRLLDCTTDYDKAMCILDAYSPSIARLVRKHGTANGKRWKDFSKDIDTTYRTLAGTANQSVS
jgi:hypothetical protein